MRFFISHTALALLYPDLEDRFATYLPVLAHLALVVHSGELHFRDPPACSLDPVAAEEVDAVAEAHCSPLAAHAGSAEVVVVLDLAEVVVGSTARCMPRPGNTGLAGAVSGPGSAELAWSTHSHLAVHRIAGHFPTLPAVHSSCSPTAHVHPGRSHDHNIAGRSGHRGPGTAAAADGSAAVVLGRSIAAADVHGCCIAPSWRRYRRAPPICLS
jgi:hypothetical protein